ncbi:MAG: sulfotransferase [Pseudomonadota bacterium]
MASDTASRQTVDEVLDLLTSGPVGHAESRCRNLLKDDPDNVNLVALLGAISLKRDHLEEARALLEQAIRMAPEFAKPYEDLGTLSLREAKTEEAIACFERALAIDDSLAIAWAGLANALEQSGRSDEADAARRRFQEHSPIARGLREAEKHAANGNFTAAEKVCNDLLRQNPNNVDVLRMQARIATDEGRGIIAEGLLKRIVKIRPNDFRGFVELGTFLGQFGRYPEAVEQLRIAFRMKPDAVAVRQRLGDYLAILGKSTEALECYDAVLELDRNHTSALVGRGHMLRILGRHDESARAYDAAVAINPGDGDAWWGLSSLRSYQLDSTQQTELDRQLQLDTTDTNNKVFMHFALARAHEDRGDYSSAWEHYVEGNTLKRTQVEYDPVETESLHDSLISTFDAALCERAAVNGSDGPAPIFIVGMPRSGSTLLEQILASHSQVEGTSELPYITILSETVGGKRTGGTPYPEALTDMTPQQFAALGKSYLYYSKDARSESKPFFTDKMPVNFQHIGLIHLALPEARIIDARRNVLDVCVGNYRQLFARGKNFSYDLFECAEYYLQYVRLMAHWNERLPGRVLTVNYEDVVADVEAQARRILDFCELPWEDGCLEFYETKRAVNTASSEQVRSPIYTGAVDFWKHYEEELGELKDILADVLPD